MRLHCFSRRWSNTVRTELKAYQIWNAGCGSATYNIHLISRILQSHIHSHAEHFHSLNSIYRLEDSGYSIGQRVTELIGLREHIVKRETRIVNMLQVLICYKLCGIEGKHGFLLKLTLTSLPVYLQFVSNVVWRHLFNKAADNLERSMENEDECESMNCSSRELIIDASRRSRLTRIVLRELSSHMIANGSVFSTKCPWLLHNLFLFTATLTFPSLIMSLKIHFSLRSYSYRYDTRECTCYECLCVCPCRHGTVKLCRFSRWNNCWCIG